MTTTTHPERRAGQRWRCEYTGERLKYTLEGTLVAIEGTGDDRNWLLSDVIRDLGPIEGSVLYEYAWSNPRMIMTLLADIPAPQPKPACGAPDWCGFLADTPTCPKRQRWIDAGEPNMYAGDGEIGFSGTPRFCSPACRDARVPPLESKPAERGCIGCGAKEAEQHKQGCSSVAARQRQNIKAPPAQEAPKACKGECMQFVGTMEHPAWKVCIQCGERFEATRARVKAKTPTQEATKAPKVPKCGNNGCETPFQNVAQRWCISLDENGNRDGVDLEWSCEPCHRMDEIEFAERTGAQSGTPYAGPERLDRPKLAHVAGNHDDDLVTW